MDKFHINFCIDLTNLCKILPYPLYKITNICYNTSAIEKYRHKPYKEDKP